MPQIGPVGPLSNLTSQNHVGLSAKANCSCGVNSGIIVARRMDDPGPALSDHLDDAYKDDIRFVLSISVNSPLVIDAAGMKVLLSQFVHQLSLRLLRVSVLVL